MPTTRRADMFMDLRDDPRENRPPLVDERSTLADVPRLFCSEADLDGDFNGAFADPVVVAEAWKAWRAEVEFAERFVAAAPSLDVTGEDPMNKHGNGGAPMSLRSALIGTVHEYARHLGHADLLRERIDGRIGQ